MMRHDLMHDVDVVRRGSVTALVSVVLVAFLAFAVGTTVYDIGKWLTAW